MTDIPVPPLTPEQREHLKEVIAMLTALDDNDRDLAARIFNSTKDPGEVVAVMLGFSYSAVIALAPFLRMTPAEVMQMVGMMLARGTEERA